MLQQQEQAPQTDVAPPFETGRKYVTSHCPAFSPRARAERISINGKVYETSSLPSGEAYLEELTSLFGLKASEECFLFRLSLVPT
jgi:hypothetical protein